MLVSFPAKASRSVSTFASGADWRLGVERLFGAVRLPLYHPNSQRFVNIFSMLIRTGVIDGYTYVCSRPGSTCMCIPYTTHVSSLEVLFTFFANSQPRVWKLYI
jgi:hypothetical protein